MFIEYATINKILYSKRNDPLTIEECFNFDKTKELFLDQLNFEKEFKAVEKEKEDMTKAKYVGWEEMNLTFDI